MLVWFALVSCRPIIKLPVKALEAYEERIRRFSSRYQPKYNCGDFRVGPRR